MHFNVSLEDQKQIDTLISKFYQSFDSRNKLPNLSHLKSLFLQSATIFQSSKSAVVTSSIDEFIKPRQVAFLSRQIRGFHEWEVTHQTLGNAKIAMRVSYYQKQGVVDGIYLDESETKTFQLVNTCQGWKIASIVWHS